MKYLNEKAMNHHSLEIGERLKCGEVFIKNINGYISFCAVECQLCEDRSICSLTKYMEHLEIWHNDWEDDLQNEEMQEVAEELATTSVNEVIQPFEKVLIVTETTKTSSDFEFSESEEISDRISEKWENSENESFSSNNNNNNNYANSIDSSDGVAYTVNISGILNAKSETSSKLSIQNDDPNECSTIEHAYLEELECQASPFSSDYNESEQTTNIAENNSNNINEENNKNVDDDVDDDVDADTNDDDDTDTDTDDDNESDKNITDPSEDSGVEKSEIGSLTASTPQHLTSEDEAEQRKHLLKEHVRIAMNEPAVKPKLTTEHLEKLLELYEEHPRLWQKTHPEYNKPKLCRKSWKEITRSWNRACKQKFNRRDIRVRISTLSSRYLKERRRREMAYEIFEPKVGTVISRFKYFDKMTFLDRNQNIPYQEFSKRMTHEHEKLLEIYRHLPILWSNTDKHHDQVELREKAYMDMSTSLQLIGIHLPPKLIRQRLAALRKRYRLEKMRRLHCKLQGKSFETSFKQFETMKFLDRYIEPFVCDTCGKIFRKLIDYQRHIVNKKHDDFEKDAATNSLISTMPYKEFELQRVEEPEQFQNELLNFSNSIYKDQNSNQYCSTSQNTILNEDILDVEESIVNFCIANNQPSNTINTYEHLANVALNSVSTDATNLIEVPYVIHSVEGNGNYFNGDQFFSLTPANNDQQMNSVIASTIENPNVTNATQENFIPMNITLQVIENGVEVPSSFMPVGLILDESVNNLVVPGASESSDVVAQYFNEDHLVSMSNGTATTTVINAPNATELSANVSECTKHFNNINEFIPMTTDYEDVGSLADDTSHNNVQNYFNHNQFMPINNEMFNSIAENSQSSATFSTTTRTSNSENCTIDTFDNDINKIIEQETEKAVDTIYSIENSDNWKTTAAAMQQPSQEVTTEGGELTALIECGDLQLNVNICPKKDAIEKPEPTLIGRLPREQTLELISRYKSFPELWHPEHEHYNSRRIRLLAWKTLAKDVNKKMKTTFNWMQIQRKILDYVKYYRHERKRVQNKRGCTQWSFYDDFKFLDDVLSPPSDLEKRIQLRTTSLKIIELYKVHPQLWNTRHPEYPKRNQRQILYTDMCLRLKEVHNITIEESKLKQRIQELRKEYRSTKIARIIAERRNESFEPLSHFEFYEPLQFLEDHVPPFECNECKIEFRAFGEYNGHMKKEHKDYKRIQDSLLADEIDKNATENICHICGIKFTLRHNLLQHLNRHYVGRTLPCSVCDKKFFTKNALREHERVHTKEPAVICADCGQTFVNTSKLNQHMKRHRNQRDHKCDQCNKLFFTAFERDKHLKRHFKIRDKVCAVCGRSFVSGSAFYTHMKLHNDKKEYQCKDCDKEFAQYAGLYKHRKRYHPNS